MKKVILAGNAVTAEIIYDYLANDSRYHVVALTVDDEYIETATLKQVSSIGLSKIVQEYSPNEYTVIMAMGYDNINRVRESMFTRLKELGYSIETYIHPDAKVYTHFPIGEGTLIFPGAVVEPFCHVGDNCMIWCNTTVAHHSRIDKNCWLAAGTVISGKVHLMQNSFLGVNSTIVNNITVGAYNLIGGSAFISKNTKPNTVHLARSAEQLRYSSEDYAKYFGV
ncbi:acetyltransferase [Desulfovibrio litoralis]|uniref:Sugar O-acyltransferase, sialic acid O-acetyltransferase NeuD family n=1 Tax=Desulfovibrio litoralis DSM 11393 TaxID=1121455 RepID=A0A1M7T279_9BACT|nr:acetyltransferase [Desulfovibrio litoralis]SHN64799.1 sugar O-acyltransferase, sialic acid O-acetyltransferase NeuD family [Desulfovibrio litoralis DSM 11393]